MELDYCPWSGRLAKIVREPQLVREAFIPKDLGKLPSDEEGGN
jgi:hypothetical protein